MRNLLYLLRHFAFHVTFANSWLFLITAGGIGHAAEKASILRCRVLGFKPPCPICPGSFVWCTLWNVYTAPQGHASCGEHLPPKEDHNTASLHMNGKFYTAVGLESKSH